MIHRRISPQRPLLLDPLPDTIHDDHRRKSSPHYSSPRLLRSSLARVALISGVVGSCVTLAFCITAFFLLQPHHYRYRSLNDQPLLSSNQLWFGLNQCNLIAKSPLDQPFSPTRINQRDASAGKSILIRNATVWDGLGNISNNTDVLLVNGLIHAIGVHLSVPNTEVLEIFADGRIVTPGIVDMHSHAGLSSYPDLKGTEDVNEKGCPNLPMMRSVDAFNPHDEALPLILAGGITSILVLPGSSNIQGGEAYVFKTPQKSTNLVQDMLMFTNLSYTNEHDAYRTGGPLWRYAKQACGENPKGTYGLDKKQPPFTRMGTAFLLRDNYQKAANLRDKQDHWCEIANRLNLKYHLDHRGIDHPQGVYPTDLHLEQVVALLRGHVKLNWHCYEVHDLETQMQIAREFNVSISSFHHALDIYMVTEALRRWQAEGRPPIGAAIFADNMWYKKEAYQGSVNAPLVLENARVPFAFKSDHPVTHAQFLVYHASKAIQYGLSEQSTLKALTSTPAKLLGLDYRIGSIEIGKDADLVIWPNPGPFAVGSLPDTVIVDGQVAFEKPDVRQQQPIPTPVCTKIPRKVQISDQMGDIIIRNIGKIVTGTRTIIGPAQIHIHNGQLVCAGKDCAKHKNASTEIDLVGGTITPPLVLAGTVLGTREISQEPSTHAGVSSSDGAYPLTYARDGIQAGGRVERALANQGIGLAISITGAAKGTPNLLTSTLLVTNYTVPHLISTLVDPNANPPLPNLEVAAVHTWVGHLAKNNGGLSASIPGQVASLAKWLTEPFTHDQSGLSSNEDLRVAKSVREGYVPLVVHAHSANEISATVHLKRRVDPHNMQRWVIAGGSESHLLVDQLASFNGTVGVVLSPALCLPSRWATRRCLSPPVPYRGSVHAASLFQKFNVPFALSSGETNMAKARNLRFDAGFVRRLANLTEQELVASVTTSPMNLMLPKRFFETQLDSLESQLQIGGCARFNAWNGDFGELQTQLLFAVDGDSDLVVNYPVQF